jgi:outer membrane receptor protein involved in Fe transport
MMKTISSLFLCCLFAASLAAQPPVALTGRLLDAAGRPLAGAIITAGNVVTTSDSLGRFQLTPLPELPFELQVTTSAGVTTRLVTTLEPLTLRLEHLQEAITVTASRQQVRVADSAASLIVVDRAELASSPAGALDDALRQVPGFTLFRRTSSRFAHPTAQGASLRGVGASGTSRALILSDGVPLNDPFGGWVYWSRIPTLALEQVEVVRGGGSTLYGSAALGGVAQLIRRQPDRTAIDIDLQGGTHGTGEVSLFGSVAGEQWRAVFSGEHYETGGYFMIAPGDRGPVDTRAASQHRSAELTLRRLTGHGSLFGRVSLFEEERDNGTLLQDNDSSIQQLELGAELIAGGGSGSLRLHASRQEFDAVFTAITAGRLSENITRIQHVPVDSWGSSAQWMHPLGGRHAVVAGADYRQVEGWSEELVFAGPLRIPTRSGGEQQMLGLFVEDLWNATGRLAITAGLRYDRWQNRRAELTSGDQSRMIPDRTDDALSPRLSVLYRLAGPWSLAGSAYRSFRAPTLNELHRGFRVGNIVTEANENLTAERTAGVEGGVNYHRLDGRGALRARLFRMTTADTVANVTLSVEPALITRQRQNVGRTESQGLELDGSWRVGGGWSVAGGWMLSRARLIDFPANRSLEGLRLPQTPEQQLTARLRHDWPRGAVAVMQGRWSGDQFDDDRNELRLGSYATIDLFSSLPVRKGAELVLAVENLLDERYEVGRTPVPTWGTPRMLRAGLRWSR